MSIHKSFSTFIILPLICLAFSHEVKSQYSSDYQPFFGSTPDIQLLQSVSSAEELFSLGLAYHQNGQYQQALASFNQVVKIYKKTTLNNSRTQGLIRVLLYITNCHTKLEQFQQALEAGLQALKLSEQATGKESAEVAASLNNLARVYEELKEYDHAIQLYQRALPMSEKFFGQEHPNVSSTLYNLAESFRNLGKYTDAKPFYERAIAIDDKNHDDKHLSQNLNQLGLIHWHLFEYEEAKIQFERALGISKKIFNPEHEVVATILRHLANVYLRLNNYKHVEQLLEQAFKIRVKLYGIRDSEAANISHDLAELHRSLGNFSKAKKFYEQIHNIAHRDVATTLRSKAALHREIGEFSKAKPLYDQALLIHEKHQMYADVVGDLNGLALWHRDRGEYSDAMSMLERALDILKKSQETIDPDLEATILNSKALLLVDLGEYSQAKSLYEKGLGIYEKLKIKINSQKALILSNLAVLLNEQGDYLTAKSLSEQAINIQKIYFGLKHPRVAISLNNLAFSQRRLGEFLQAMQTSETALIINEEIYGSEHAVVAANLSNLADIHDDFGEHVEAKWLYERALRIAENANQPQLLWSIQGSISNRLTKLKQPEAAILFGKLAINTLQTQRGRLKSMEEDLQKSFLKKVNMLYHNLANLLIEQGRLPEAQQVWTMLKEEEFYEYTRRDYENDTRSTRASLNPTETTWFKEHQNIANQLAMLGEEKRKLTDKDARSKAENIRLHKLEQRLENVSHDFQRTLDKLAKVFDQAGSTAYAQKQKELKLEKDMTKLVGTLGNGVVLLETVTMDDGIWLLLTTSETRKKHKVEISKKELNQRLFTFREKLNSAEYDPREAGQALHNLLIAPLQADLQQANTKVLMVSLDGALRYIPFAALHDGKQYLIEQYALSSFNGAAQDNLKAKPNPSWKVAGLGTSNAHPGFSPLPAVKDELNGIVRQNVKDSKGVLDGVIHLNQDFNQKQLQQVMHKDYPVLHIASHFQFKPGTEKDSFLLLGDGTRLDLGEIRKGNYSFKGIDLFTLSACSTAVGGDGEGREVEGLSVMAQKKGAKGVLATLWSVADQSTSLLMQTMYRLHQAEQLNKAEALRQAQLALLRGTAATTNTAPTNSSRAEIQATSRIESNKTFHHDKRRPYAHPYYWAPFVLMGNWL